MASEHLSGIGAALVRAAGPVVVINLDTRIDRLRDVTQELARIGLGFDDVSVRRFSAICPTETAGFPSVGVRGCFLSHLGVLDIAVKEGWGGVVIVEDDMDFVSGAEARLRLVLPHLATLDWGILHGGTNHAVKGAHLDGAAGLQAVDPEVELQLTHFIAFRGPVVRQVRDFLQAILTREPGDPAGGPMDVDGAYHHFRSAHPQVLTVLAHPPFAIQRPSPTDVRDRGLLDRIGLLVPILDLARRFKREVMRQRWMP